MNKLKQRSYRYYMIVRNLGKDTEEFVHRTTHFEQAEDLFRKTGNTTKVNDTVYLVEIQVLAKREIIDE